MVDLIEWREWLIRKNGYFYRPNRAGYTSVKAEAGRYTEKEARREAAIEPGNMTALHQDEVPTPVNHDTDTIDSLRTALAAERERAEKAEKDTARLNFLDRCNQRLNAAYGTNYRWELILNHNVNRLMLGHMEVDLNDAKAHGLNSCRDAIDDAMNRAAARFLAQDADRPAPEEKMP